MKKVIETRIEEVVVMADFCDICENQLGELDGQGYLHEGSALLSFNFGYLSHEKDGDQGSFMFCQNCAEQLFNHVKSLNPTLRLTNYMSSYSEEE